MKSGSSESATLTFTAPERERQCSMSSTKSVGQLGAVDLAEERDLRVRGRDDERRAQLGAVVERDADDAAVAHEDPLDGRVGAHVGAEGLGRPADRVADRAHPAAREAPRPELAVADVADRVVQHDVRGAGLLRAGPRADDAVDRHARP